MRAEELDNLTEKQLLDRANACFIEAENTNINNQSGPEERLRLHLDAQYYLTLVARKRDEWIARRDFWMEIGVMLLIGAELLLSAFGLYYAIHDGNLEGSALQKVDTELGDLNSKIDATVGRLDTLNGQIKMEADNVAKSASIFQKLYELQSAHPILEVRALQRRPDGGVGTLLLKANSSDQTPTMMLTQDLGGIWGDFIIRNVGTQTADGVEVTTVPPQAITVGCVEYPLRLPGAMHSHNEPCGVIQGPQTILPRPPGRSEGFPPGRYPGPDYHPQYDLLTRVRIKHVDIDANRFRLVLRIRVSNPLQEDTYEVMCVAP